MRQKIFQIILLIATIIGGIFYYKIISNPSLRWDIFENSEFNYRFRYPTTTEIYLFDEKGNDILVVNRIGTSTIVNVFKNYPSEHLFQIYAERMPVLNEKLEFSYIDRFFPGSTKIATEISGIKGYRVSSINHPVYFLEKNRIIYLIDFISNSTSTFSLSEQILKTFKIKK